MGSKNSFPGFPRSGPAPAFRERQVIAAAAAAAGEGDAELREQLEDCQERVDELKARAIDPDFGPREIAEALVGLVLDDIGPARFDEIAVALVQAFEQAMFKQVSRNPA